MSWGLNLCCMLVSLIVIIHLVSMTTQSSRGSSALTVIDANEDVKHEVTVEDEIDDVFDPLDVFYPTKRWKSVKPGQTIPAGLHVRLDLETGKREAKLMDGDDGLKYWKQDGRQGMVNTQKKSFTKEELKEALKEFKAEDDDVTTSESHKKKIKSEFRSYEDLKKTLAALNMGIKTDAEIVTELTKILNSNELTTNVTITILTDLEYMLHQIDNALLFSDLGGIAMLGRLLNSSDPQIRAHAAFVLGSATQSNPEVQVSAMQSGLITPLLRLISLKTLPDIRSRMLYALSALVRHFPAAQGEFMKHGGLSVLAKLFKKTGTERLRVKAVTLVSDLVTELQYAVLHTDPADSKQMEKLQQYQQIPLLLSIINDGWCDLVPTLLTSRDHDTREKTLNAMSILMDTCRDTFSHSQHVLEELSLEYMKLLYKEQLENDSDDYFNNLHHSVDSILLKIQFKQDLHVSRTLKDEL